MSAYTFDSDLQPQKRSKGLISFIVILMFILLVLTFILGYMLATLASASDIAEHTAMVADYEELAEEHRILEQSYDAIKEEYFAFRSETAFWSRDNVVVAKGETIYHAYGCDTISHSQYKIYHVNDAAEHGFTRCEECNAPEPFSEEERRIVPITIW